MLAPLSNDDALRLLTVHYGGPGRFYHGPNHLLGVMKLWGIYASAGEWDHPVDAGLALAYHDAHYRALSNRNEETSAAMAVVVAARYPVDTDRVRRMILATKRHLEEFEMDGDTARVLDIDLAGMGRSWEEYDLNYKACRCEFSALTDAEWVRGRSEFIQKMLSRKSIYRLFAPPGSSEGNARSNLEREAEMLRLAAQEESDE